MKDFDHIDVWLMRKKFMNHVRVESGKDGCWIWTGAKRTSNSGPRGVVCVARWNKKSKSEEARRYIAHRASWVLHVGPIPTGMNVLHSCDVTLCVRPSHLFIGTQKDNMRDCAKKGRIRNRPRKPFLTSNAVCQIRQRYATGERASAIALDFDIHRTTVIKIGKGRRHAA